MRVRASQIFMIKVDAIPGQWEDRADEEAANEIAARHRGAKMWLP